MDWLASYHAVIDCRLKTVSCINDLGAKVEIVGIQRPISLRMISAMQLKRCLHQGCQLFATTVTDLEEGES